MLQQLDNLDHPDEASPVEQKKAEGIDLPNVCSIRERSRAVGEHISELRSCMGAAHVDHCTVDVFGAYRGWWEDDFQLGSLNRLENVLTLETWRV